MRKEGSKYLKSKTDS